MTIYSLEYTFPSFEPSHCSMSGSVASWAAFRFLRGQERWSGIPITWRIFQFVVIHTVKDFSIVNDVDFFFTFFLNFLVFPMMQWMLAVWSLIPLPFLNLAWSSGISWFMYCWRLAWRILSINLLACEMSTVVQYFEHSLALPFLGVGMKTDLFHSCAHCWVF